MAVSIVPRCSRRVLLAPRFGPLLLLLVWLCWCTVSVQSQSYIPQPAPFSSCPGGQTLLTLGNMDSTRLLGASNAPHSSGGDTQYFSLTPFTLRGQSAFGVQIYQMAISLGDNSYGYGLFHPVHMRLAIYLYQEAENNTESFDLATLVAQTDEITLYPSGGQILYANLLQPVILDSEGDYGMAVYADDVFQAALGEPGTGMYGLGQFNDLSYGYNDYTAPEGVLLYPGDQAHSISATGCLDSSQFRQPNHTYYAFCALVESYQREPANNSNPLVTSLTNVTRYSGVIAVQSNVSVQTSYGTGYPITYMEGEVQVSSNAGAFVYPPLGLRATPFFYRSSASSSSSSSGLFSNASDLLYPNMSIPVDRSGILFTTTRNQSVLYCTNVSVDSTIGQRGEAGTTNTYFSSFDIFPADQLEQVITACNVPIGFQYYADNFQCAPDAAPVSFGDINLDDVDPVEQDTIMDRLPPNLISFRFFTAWTPNTTIYQLSYYTYTNLVAIIHLRMGLFATNTTYVNSFSATPQYQLLQQTDEIELVNVDDTLITANLMTPVVLTQNHRYAIGVWSDSLLYGPQASWGVNAAGAPLPYSAVDIDGSFPKQVLALGGQTGTQPMSAIGCVAKERLIAFQWCATFGSYMEVAGHRWLLSRRNYAGTFWALATPYTNEWGTYHILVAGNGTMWGSFEDVPSPPSRNRSRGWVQQEWKEAAAAHTSSEWWARTLPSEGELRRDPPSIW